MPELPEVETSRLGIKPYIQQQKIADIIIRQYKLRWPIPQNLPALATGQTVEQVQRRGKYLILPLQTGSIIIHLGMSGSLHIVAADDHADKHDHIDFCFANKKILRLHDPRKFGSVLWTEQNPLNHKLIRELGPEPLSDAFTTDYLYQHTRQRTASIKALMMNGHIVVGVGNIYANESLYRAGINPKRKAGSLSAKACQRLVAAIKNILTAAIKQGGTTLRDFTAEDGHPGYFSQQLCVYGKAGQTCPSCGNTIKQITQQQRSTFYCTRCQR